MSDNHDKRLEDLGWEKMNALLDKEMPVKKSPRRGLIFWWMAAGFALLLATLFLFPSENDPIQQAFIQPEKNHSNDDSELEALKKINNEKANVPVHENLPLNNRKVTHPQDNQVAKNTVRAENQIANPKLIASQENPTINQSNDFQESSTNSSPAYSAEEKNMLPALKNEKTYQLSALEKIDWLAIRPVDHVEKEKNLHATSTLLEPLSTSRKIRWDFQVGAMTEEFAAFNGVDGSFLLSVPLSNRWRLNSGIGLAYLMNPKVVVHSTDTLQYGINPTYDPTTEEARAVSKSRESFVENKSFFLLEIPVLVEYAISPKWKAFGGVKNSILLPGITTQTLDQVELITADANSLSNQVFTASYSYPGYTLSGVVGARYHISSSIFAWGQYQHAFPFNNTPVGYFNNRFTLGAGFSF